MYFKELNEVISQSDVIIEVLDARDPNGCRSLSIERKIISLKSNLFDSGTKKLILLINKIDLIPKNVLSTWMKILKKEYPIIAFKASTQSQTRKLHSNIKYNKATLKKNKNINNKSNKIHRAVTNRCIGADALMSLLKNYSRSNDSKQRITVGVKCITRNLIILALILAHFYSFYIFLTFLSFYFFFFQFLICLNVKTCFLGNFFDFECF